MIPRYNDKLLGDTIEDWQEFNNILLEYRIAEIVQHVNQGPVLDVGCGNGEISAAIAELGMLVNGIDPDETKIKKASDIADIVFEVGDIETWKAPYLYSTVVCSHVLEHSVNPYTFLVACHNALDIKGKIIVTCPNALSLNKRIADIMELSEPFKLSVTDKLQDHVVLFDRDRMRGLLVAAGFEVVVESGIMLKPFASAQMAKYLDARWHDAFYEIGKDPHLIDYCSSLLMVGRKP